MVCPEFVKARIKSAYFRFLANSVFQFIAVGHLGLTYLVLPALAKQQAPSMVRFGEIMLNEDNAQEEDLTVHQSDAGQLGGGWAIKRVP